MAEQLNLLQLENIQNLTSNFLCFRTTTTSAGSSSSSDSFSLMSNPNAGQSSGILSNSVQSSVILSNVGPTAILSNSGQSSSADTQQKNLLLKSLLNASFATSGGDQNNEPGSVSNSRILQLLSQVNKISYPGLLECVQ